MAKHIFSLNDFIIIAIPFRQLVELLETKNWAELKEFSPKDAEMLEKIIGRIKTKIKCKPFININASQLKYTFTYFNILASYNFYYQ